MSTEPELIVEKGPQMGQEYPLSDLPLAVGRVSANDLVINDLGVSRKHARFTLDGSQFFVEDLGSSNGTFVNGERIEEPRRLQNGDRLRLGPNVELRVVLPPEEAATMLAPPVADQDASATMISVPAEAAIPEAMASQPPELSQPRLIVRRPDGTVSEHELATSEISLGRLSENDIAVDVPIVSRRHLQLERDGDRYRLHVLPSASNPVFINGEMVTGERWLTDGDELTIGHESSEMAVHLRYRSAAELQPTAVPAMPSADEPDEEFPMTQILDQAVDLGETEAQEPGTATIIGTTPPPVSTIPPQLVVTIAGREPAVFTLTAERLRVGRLKENDVVIESPIVSRHHAVLERQGIDYVLVPSPEASNPLFLDGGPVTSPTTLHHGAKMRIGGSSPGQMVTMVYLAPEEETGPAAQQIIQFTENKVMTIGRDEQNDIVLNAPTVSRYHAQVEQIGQRYRVRDLRSSNGTFVNGELVKGEIWVQPGDAVYVGPYRFVVGDREFAQYDESEGGMRIEAFGLNKWVRKDLNILQDISLALQPREFVVVVGQSGGGKSTLVDAIAGYRPATHGRVIVNDTIEVYKEFDAIRNTIGYVPQKDIIHMELTVFQALDYAAQLRMPPDTTIEERHARVQEVMEELDLAHRSDTQISELSGGQQKRVSIGVELLTKPGLFFLDEPTSGLDPGMETDLMQLMRRLADQGRTIVLITHATKNVMLADKVVFLARGGYLTWFGPPEEALAYFDQFRTERQRRSSPMEFDDIYGLLDNPELGSGADWAERFRSQPAFSQYIAEPLEDKAPVGTEAAPAVSSAPAQRKQVSGLRQFLILSARNLKIITRDRFSLALMLLSAPLMASLDFIIAFSVGRNPFGFFGGDLNDIVVSMVVLTNTGILVGGLSQMRELVKEREIYKRERMVNLRLFPYIMSKIWVALLLAVYQAFFFTLIRYLAFDMPGGSSEMILFYITVFLLVVAGMMLGLFASALAPNANAAPLLLIMFIIPQMVLSGGLVPLPDIVKAPASSSWTLRTVMGLTGVGSDVAGDACWDLSEEEQKQLTSEQKEAQCDCLGVNALREESCNFPGLGELYVEAIDEPDPVKPPDLRPEPEAPVFPDEPVQPEDPNDAAAVQTYLSELAAYNEEVDSLREDYESDLSEWRSEQAQYQAQLTSYQTELADLEVSRGTAVGSAEATIRRFNEDFGWSFVDKDDDTAYRRMLITTWGAQVILIVLYFAVTVVVQKKRDV